MVLASYYLWIAPHILLGIVLIWVLRQGLQRQLPIFAGYVVFELLQFIVLFTISVHSPFSPATYKWSLIVGEGISSILELGVIYELSNKLLLSHSTLRPVLRPALQGVLGAACIRRCCRFGGVRRNQRSHGH
jgi:hypothetical protein